jgi:hypothetical protein
MEAIQSNGMFESFKKVTIAFSNQVGESFRVYENGHYYISGDFLYLVFIGSKKKSIVNLRLAHRVEIEQ